MSCRGMPRSPLSGARNKVSAVRRCVRRPQQQRPLAAGRQGPPSARSTHRRHVEGVCRPGPCLPVHARCRRRRHGQLAADQRGAGGRRRARPDALVAGARLALVVAAPVHGRGVVRRAHLVHRGQHRRVQRVRHLHIEPFAGHRHAAGHLPGRASRRRRVRHRHHQAVAAIRAGDRVDQLPAGVPVPETELDAGSTGTGTPPGLGAQAVLARDLPGRDADHAGEARRIAGVRRGTRPAQAGERARPAHQGLHLHRPTAARVPRRRLRHHGRLRRIALLPVGRPAQGPVSNACIALPRASRPHVAAAVVRRRPGAVAVRRVRPEGRPAGTFPHARVLPGRGRRLPRTRPAPPDPIQCLGAGVRRRPAGPGRLVAGVDRLGGAVGRDDRAGLSSHVRPRQPAVGPRGTARRPGAGRGHPRVGSRRSHQEARMNVRQMCV